MLGQKWFWAIRFFFSQFILFSNLQSTISVLSFVLFSKGLGHSNDLGDQPNELGDYLPSVQLPTGIEIFYFGTGYQFSGIVTSSSQNLFLWGNNDEAQLGIENIVDVGDLPNQMGDYLKQTRVGSGRSVVQIQGGRDHSVCKIHLEALYLFFF